MKNSKEPPGKVRIQQAGSPYVEPTLDQPFIRCSNINQTLYGHLLPAGRLTKKIIFRDFLTYIYKYISKYILRLFI